MKKSTNYVPADFYDDMWDKSRTSKSGSRSKAKNVVNFKMVWMNEELFDSFLSREELISLEAIRRVYTNSKWNFANICPMIFIKIMD